MMDRIHASVRKNMTKPTQKGKLGLIFSTFVQGKNSVFGLRRNQVEHQNAVE
jgi:hypothetical protein